MEHAFAFRAINLTLRRNIMSRQYFGVSALTESEEKKEITVKAPSKSVIAPEKKAEKEAEKALEEERYNVLQIPIKIGKYIGISSMCGGIALFVLLAYAGLTNQNNWALLTDTTSAPVVGLWIVIGLVSVVVGFLLMGSE